MDANSYHAGRSDGLKAGRAENIGAGLLESIETEKRIEELEAKLAGVEAMKERLKSALREVAPNHELVTPYERNPVLVATFAEAQAQHLAHAAERKKEGAARQSAAFANMRAERRRGNLWGFALVVVAVVVAYWVLR
jgi:hypothetical protein